MAITSITDAPLIGLSPEDPAFWQGMGARILLPSPAVAAPDLAGLPLPAGAVVFSSSGSTGDPKFTVLTRQALLASARLVVDWLGIGAGDRLLCPLPLYHVGGFGILARARVAGAAFQVIDTRWNAGNFATIARDWRATITSLVPSQVFDLVRERVVSPPSLRLVVVGGGHLAPDLDSEARQLGWPILASFGMTETASQIATEKPGLRAPGAGWLPVVDGWSVANASDGRLRVRGDGLFAGRLRHGSSGWIFEPVETEENWFTTSDYAEITRSNGQDWVRPLGRADDSIKIRGELVALSAVARELDGLARAAGLHPADVAIIDIADPRAGRALVLAGAASAAGQLPALCDAFNRRAPAFARIEKVVQLDRIPRSPLGKLQRTRLREQLDRLVARPG